MNQAKKELTKKELNSYKDVAINILETQISMLADIQSEILNREDTDANIDETNVTTNNEGILTTKTCKAFQETLKGEMHKLQNFDVVLAVVGTMKAGKSTTINAIVGREILPNRNRPMTSLPTLICHNREQQTPKLTFNSAPINELLAEIKTAIPIYEIENPSSEIVELVDFIQTGSLFSDSYHGETEIFNFLQRLNDLVRLTSTLNVIADKETFNFPYNSYKNVDALPTIEIAFKLEEEFETDGRFMLLDTAGPNESGHKELLSLLREQLKRSSAVMLVLDYTQLNSEAEESIKNEIEAIPTIQKSRLFALVNKFDQESANADDANSTKRHIFNNLLKDKIDFEHIYPISARDAYLANRMETYLLEHNEKPEFKEGTWIEDFAKQVLGKRAEQKYSKMDIEDIPEELDELLKDSLMAEPLTNVILNMQKNAPYIAIQSALAGASDVFEKLHNFFNIRGHFANKEKMTNEEINKLEKAILQLQTQISSLETKSISIKKGFLTVQESALKRMNSKEKERGISTNISISLDAMFNMGLHTTKEQAEELEKKAKENWYKLRKASALKEESTKLAVAEELKSKSTESVTVFSNKEDLNKFSEQIEGRLLFISKTVSDEYEELLKESVEETRNLTENLHQECNKVLINLQEEFNKEGIKNIKIPSLDLKIKRNESSIVKNFSLDSKFSKEQVTKKQTGITGSTKRMFGSLFKKNWGSFTVDLETYSINKYEMTEKLEFLLNSKLVSPLREEIKSMLSDLLEKNMLAIDQFNKTIKNSVEEMNNAIIQEKMPDLETKKDYKKKIMNLQQLSQKIEEDWESLSEKFNVEKVETESKTNMVAA